MKFFELSDEKFTEVLRRISLWGYDVCLEEFILEYYLAIKKDNLLRQFVILHLDKLVGRLQNIIEDKFYKGINKFNFSDIKDQKSLQNLQNKLADKEAELLSIQPEKLAEDTTDEILETEDLTRIKRSDFK